MALYKMTEWESLSSGWYCGCVDNLGGGSNLWYLPARILDISPAEFIELLVTKYKPDNIWYSKENCILCYSWKDQSKMRKFKNDMNAAARKKNFQI